MKKTVALFSMIFLFLSTLIFAAGAADYAKQGSALFKKGDFKKALSYYSQAAKLEPRNASYYTAIAACYMKLGNKAAADKYSKYAKSLTSRPGPGYSAPAAAGSKIKVSAFGGFTLASMSDINRMTDETYANVTSAGGTGEVNHIGAGFMTGAQAGYSFINGLYVGPRFEYIAIFSATSTSSGTLWGFTASGTSEYGASLVNLMLGASYNLPLSGMPLTISGDLYMGYGMAGLVSNGSATITPPGTTTTINAAYSGGTFAGVLCAGAEYKISNLFSAGLSLGYRLANVASVTADADVANTTILKGDVFVDSDDNPVPVDFSGLIVSVSANLAF